MIKITDIILTAEQIVGSREGVALAVGISEGYQYEDGKRTENITHKKVEIVIPSRKYEKVTVKVQGVKHPLSTELLAQNGGAVKVRFKNLLGKFYRTSSGEYALSCTADGIEVIA